MTSEEKRAGEAAGSLKLSVFDRVLQDVTGAVFITMTLLVIAQVFFRNVAALTRMSMPFWTEDIARHIMPVSVFLGAAVGFQNCSSHIVVNIVSKRFPPRFAAILEVIKFVLLIGLVGLVLIGFWESGQRARQTPLSTTYAIKLGWFHYAICVTLLIKLSYLARWLFIRIREAASLLQRRQ